MTYALIRNLSKILPFKNWLLLAVVVLIPMEAVEVLSRLAVIGI